jgi:LytS/YehU family sensor histidine kinase
MNPHFFYNALNTIQAFIFTNDKTRANNYLAKFSKLTRLILENSEKETITLQDEINALQLYLELEKMRFSDTFEFSIQTNENLDSEFIEIPPMLIQPYVENAIKHGLLHLETNRMLKINFTFIDKLLTVTIDDNGVGRKRSGEINSMKHEKPKSFSSKANQSRLEILNKGRTSKIGVEYIDKITGNGVSAGTTVTLTIPI